MVSPHSDKTADEALCYYGCSSCMFLRRRVLNDYRYRAVAFPYVYVWKLGGLTGDVNSR